MKKSLLLSCLSALLVSTTFAQSHRLTSILPDDESVFDTYSYDQTNRYTRHDHEDAYGYLYYDSLTYNDLGQIVEDATYQDMEWDGNYILVSKCCYGYNENGKLSWRDNYNSFGTEELTQSAHISYEYDENGNRTRENQCWANDPENPFMVIEYAYNEAGQLISATEEMEDWFNPGAFETIGKTLYTYDAQGRLATNSYYYVSYGYEDLASAEYYTYDENGNLIESELKYASGAVDNRHEFAYDLTVPASDVVYPASNEYKVDYSFGIQNMRLEDKNYKRDDNTGELALAFTNIYSYEDAVVGIRTLALTPSTAFFVDADTKVMHLGNADCTLRIYTQGGQVALSTQAHGKADLSSLIAGIYVATIQQGSERSYLKFVVK